MPLIQVTSGGQRNLLKKKLQVCESQQSCLFVGDQILIFHHNLQINSLKILQCDFLDFFLILSLIVEVYLWWKLQASLIFLSGRTCTIGGWLNTFLPHCSWHIISCSWKCAISIQLLWSYIIWKLGVFVLLEKKFSQHRPINLLVELVDGLPCFKNGWKNSNMDNTFTISSYLLTVLMHQLTLTMSSIFLQHLLTFVC